MAKKRSVMQGGESPPAIENPGKPAMTGRKPRPRRVVDKMEYMPEAPATAPEGEAPGTGVEVAPPAPPVPPSLMPPMEPRPAAASAERYVRLMVRVSGDQMEVVGARMVEGPLVQPEPLHTGLVYEAAIDEKQVARAAVRDAGVRRSFPQPGATGAMAGHHIKELPSYEFPVRIPQQEMSEESLPSLRISLYRVRGGLPAEHVTGETLHAQFPDALRVVAELDGIRLDDLPDQVQAELRKAVQR